MSHSWPIIFPVAFVFIAKLSTTTPSLILGSVLLGITIGLTEEILWRGVYVKLFWGNVWLDAIYPSVTFGLWHIAPISVRPSTMPGGVASFVLYAILLGLSYAYYARKTGSSRWCTISHIILDSFGLGAFAYAAWLV